MKHGRVTKKLAFLYWFNRTLFTRKIFPHPIGPGQGTFLIYLAQDTDLRQDDLVSLVGVDKAIGTRVIRKLSDAGYIRRRRDPEDHRAYLLALTDKGAAMKPVIIKVIDSVNMSLFQDFTEEERDTMHNYLDRMIENMRRVSSSGTEEAALEKSTFPTSPMKLP